MLRTSFVATLLLCAATAAPALGQESDPSADATANSTPPPQDEAAPVAAPALTLSGAVMGVTDYRFRGLTQSSQDAALQATATLKHRSGFYVGAWGSTLRDLGDYGDVEVDLYAGFSRNFGTGFTGDVGALYYYYPDGRGNTDFGEVYGSVSHVIGPVSAKLGAAYAPEGQSGLGDADNLYLFTDLAVGVPTTPLTVKAHLGYSDGALAAFADGDYLDYAIGVEASADFVTLGLSYINTDIRNRFGARDAAGADGTIVGTLSFNF